MRCHAGLDAASPAAWAPHSEALRGDAPCSLTFRSRPDTTQPAFAGVCGCRSNLVSGANSLTGEFPGLPPREPQPKPTPGPAECQLQRGILESRTRTRLSGLTHHRANAAMANAHMRSSLVPNSSWGSQETTLRKTPYKTEEIGRSQSKTAGYFLRNSNLAVGT